MELVGGQIVSSTHLFSIARGAYERSRKSVSYDRQPCDGEPLVSVVFAAAATEAFSNELGQLAELSLGESEPPVIASLAALLREAETSRGSAGLKIQLAKMALSGTAYAKGAPPISGF